MVVSSGIKSIFINNAGIKRVMSTGVVVWEEYVNPCVSVCQGCESPCEYDTQGYKYEPSPCYLGGQKCGKKQ